MKKIHSEVVDHGRVKVVPRKVLAYRPIVTLYAKAICSDCGNTGCLIPVPHKVKS